MIARAGLRLLKASGAYDGFFNDWRGALFDDAEKLKLHVMPVHYYSPVPNVAALRKEPDQTAHVVTGVDLRIDAGLEFAQELGAVYRGELARLSHAAVGERQRFDISNGAYGPGDAEIYYCFLRHFMPARVIEVGCGNSTLIASMALDQNSKDRPDRLASYVCIEPFLPDYLKPLPPGITDVIESPVQSVPMARFEALEAGDILFLDSTHVVARGSDTIYEFLEILPRLKSGVIIHIHDIFFPDDYPLVWLTDMRFFWNEQYLLQAFLLNNAAFEVILPARALFTRHSAAFAAVFPSVSRGGIGPSSFWMRKT